MIGLCRPLCVTAVSANKYRGLNEQTEHSSIQFKACTHYNRVLTGERNMMTDTQLGELKGLH